MIVGVRIYGQVILNALPNLMKLQLRTRIHQ